MTDKPEYSYEPLTLQGLIAILEKIVAEKGEDYKVKIGFANPHSYRGYYDQLAFEPVANITLKGMLFYAREAVGSTYSGWKGGNYTMTEYTNVHLAVEGCCGAELTGTMVALIVGDIQEAIDSLKGPVPYWVPKQCEAGGHKIIEEFGHCYCRKERLDK